MACNALVMVILRGRRGDLRGLLFGDGGFWLILIYKGGKVRCTVHVILIFCFRDIDMGA